MTDDALSRHARLLARLVSVPLTLLLLLAAVLVGNAVIQRGGDFLPFLVIYYTPMLFYIAAIAMVRSALRSIGRGGEIAAVLPGLLSRAGAALFVGALFKEVGVPALTWLVSGSAYIRPFEPSALTLGIVGAMLVIVGQLFGRAAAAEAELRQII